MTEFNKRGALTHIDATVDGEVTLDRMAGELISWKTEKKRRVFDISSNNQLVVIRVLWPDVAKAYEKIKNGKQLMVII